MVVIGREPKDLSSGTKLERDKITQDVTLVLTEVFMVGLRGKEYEGMSTPRGGYGCARRKGVRGYECSMFRVRVEKMEGGRSGVDR